MKNGELCKFNPYFFYTLGSEAMFAYAALLPSAAPTDPTSQSQCDMQVSPDASSDLRVLKCHARKNGYVPAIVTCCSAAPSTVLRSCNQNSLSAESSTNSSALLTVNRPESFSLRDCGKSESIEAFAVFSLRPDHSLVVFFFVFF